MLVALLKIHEALLQVGERGKIVRSEYLSLNDGEIDFNLVEPAGMNGSVDKKSVGPSGPDAIDCLLAAMSRAVVHDPKDALGGFIRFTAHPLRDEPIGGSNATVFFAVSEDLGSMDVPSCPIGPSTLAEILMLNPHASASGNGQGGLFATSRLNTGFFVGRDHEFRTLQRFPLPDASVEIEDAPGFASEIGIAWKDPTTVLPGTKGISTQPTPECRATDLGNDALSHCLLPNIGQRQARQRQPQAMGKLTGQSFYLHDDAGGKRGRDARLEVVLQGPADEPVQIACATCSRSGAACPSVRQ